MLALAVVQLAMAAVMSRWRQPRIWWSAAGVILAIAAVFFALANWGTSDIARLNHFLGVDPSEVLNEPFWLAIAPLVVVLPYRMASVQWVVATSYALGADAVGAQLGCDLAAGAGMVLWGPWQWSGARCCTIPSRTA